MRRVDTQEDHYTITFLEDRVKNEMILQMINSNEFKNGKMQIKDKLNFRISVGADNFQLQYYEGMRVYEWPFVKSYLKKAHSDEFQFLLTQSGLRICKGVKKLVTEYMTVDQGSYQWVVWADGRYKFSDVDNTAWILKPLNESDPNC